jgi:hypothetical protein
VSEWGEVRDLIKESKRARETIGERGSRGEWREEGIGRREVNVLPLWSFEGVEEIK